MSGIVLSISVSGGVSPQGLLKILHPRSFSLALVCWLTGSGSLDALDGDGGLSWEGWRGLGGKRTAVGPLLPSSDSTLVSFLCVFS